MLIFALGLIPAILYLFAVSAIGFLFWFTTPSPGQESRRSFAACARALVTVGLCLTALGLAGLSGANYFALRNEQALLKDNQDYEKMDGVIRTHKSLKPFSLVAAQCEVQCGSEADLIELPVSQNASEFATGTKIPLLVKPSIDGEKPAHFYVVSELGKRDASFWIIHSASLVLAFVFVVLAIVIWPRGGSAAAATPYPAEFVQILMARAGTTCSLEEAKFIAEQWAQGILPEEQNEQLEQVTSEYVEELAGTNQEKQTS